MTNAVIILLVIILKKEILFSCREDVLKIHHTLTAEPSVNNFAFQSHSHNMYEIYLFLAGEGDFVVEGNVIPLERGTLIFTLCGQTHKLLLKSSEEPYERIVLMFGEKYFPKNCEDLLEIASNRGCVANLSEQEINWFLQTIEIFKKSTTQTSVNILASSFINLSIYKIMSISRASNFYEETEDDLVKQIIRYIDRNLSKSISLDIFGKAFYRDKAYLGRKFKSVMGCSIWEYITRKRIFSAREQLYLTQSVQDAFSSSGFGDYSAFYRKYKKYVGCSPTEELKQLNEN